MSNKTYDVSWTASPSGYSTWFKHGKITKELALKQFKEFGFRYKRADTKEPLLDYERLCVREEIKEPPVRMRHCTAQCDGCPHASEHENISGCPSGCADCVPVSDISKCSSCVHEFKSNFNPFPVTLKVTSKEEGLGLLRGVREHAPALLYELQCFLITNGVIEKTP